MVHLPARRIEKALDIFADHRRSRSPIKAALRLAAALHAAHAIASHKKDVICFNEYDSHDLDPAIGEFQNAVQKLNWACNGVCSQCKRPYIPYLLDHATDSISKALAQVVVSLRPLSSPLNMDLAASFTRILVESRILTCSELESFDIPTALRTYLEGLQYGHRPKDSSSSVIAGLTRAIGTIEEQKNLEASGGPARFHPDMARVNAASTLLPKIDELSQLGRESDDSLLNQISAVQLCTFASCISGKRLKLPQVRAERLMEQLKELRVRSDLPAFLISHAENARATLLNKLVDDSCHSLRLEGHRSIVKSAAFSTNLSRVVTGADNGTVCLWDTATGCLITKLEGHTDWVNSVAYSPDEGQIISSSEDHSIRHWDAESQQEISTLKKYNGQGRVVAFSQDGSRVAFGTSVHDIQLWNAMEKRKEFLLEGHTWPISALAFSRSGMRIVSGSWDADVRIWSIEGKTGGSIATLKGHTDWVLSAVFSPDDSFIVSGSKDKTIRCWDVRTRQQTAILIGHTDRVISVAVSPGGHHVISASDDNTVRLWDLRTESQAGILRGHSALVRTVAFSPDGTQVIAACWDSSISKWDISMLITDEPSGLRLPKLQLYRKSIILV